MISDAWKLCDRLSVVQASLLVAGHEPADFQSKEEWQIDKQASHFLAVKTALLAAILEREGFGEITWTHDQFNNNFVEIRASFVRTEPLRIFLGEKGMVDNYFSDHFENRPGYLEPDHPRFAPQLAAAVEAWMHVQNLPDLQGRTPKKAIEKWLRENAARFNMTDDDGTANESAIERIARVCNWQPQGGAPATPSSNLNNQERLPEVRPIRLAPPASAPSTDYDLDDDIPF
ncbi:MAG: hypothetical protein AAFX52_15225 [Pseudomonadota bacterium]